MNQKPAKTTLNGAARTQPTATTVAAELPSPEIIPKAKRRNFSAGYKRRIVRAADECRQKGEIGALLRREGLYSSQLSEWRKQAARGQLNGSQASQRGRQPKQTAEQKENTKLRKEITRLEQQLAEAELLIAAQKKVSELLALMSQQRKGQP